MSNIGWVTGCIGLVSLYGPKNSAGINQVNDCGLNIGAVHTYTWLNPIVQIFLDKTTRCQECLSATIHNSEIFDAQFITVPHDLPNDSFVEDMNYLLIDNNMEHLVCLWIPMLLKLLKKGGPRCAPNHFFHGLNRLLMGLLVKFSILVTEESYPNNYSSNIKPIFLYQPIIPLSNITPLILRIFHIGLVYL